MKKFFKVCVALRKKNLDTHANRESSLSDSSINSSLSNNNNNGDIFSELYFFRTSDKSRESGKRSQVNLLFLFFSHLVLFYHKIAQ